MADEGASCRRNAAALLALRSISYCAPPIANRTVSSAGPPSRSSSSATVTFCAIPGLPCLVSDISPYKINRQAVTATPLPASQPLNARAQRQKRATCARPGCILLPPLAWHQDGPGEPRKRHPVDRGKGLRYSCPPSDQGRCSRNRVGVDLLRPSRRRRWIRRTHRFALPRRVDACGALAGSHVVRGRKCWLPKWTGGLSATRPSRTEEANSSLSTSTSRYSFRAEGSVRPSCDQSRCEPEQKESRQSLLARAGTPRAWPGSRFPGGNTSGTSSPTKRKTNGPGQSDRGSARYDCGKNS